MERTLFGKPARFEGGLHEVADGVFAWLQPNGEWGESNAGLIAGDGEAMLIDTLFDPGLTQRMLGRMDAEVGLPIRLLVNTHSDGDHVWGNQLLAGIPIIATAAAAHLIREDPPATLVRFQKLAPRLRQLGRLPLPLIGSLPLPVLPRLPLRELGAYVEHAFGRYHFASVRLTPPTQEFSGGLIGDVGGREVRLIEVGPAHTKGDLIVHVPDAGVVFAADILFVGVAPVMWAGPTSNWIAALDRILALGPRAVVPGHGPVSGVAGVELLREYLSWVDAEATRLLAAGRSVADTAGQLLRSPDYRAAAWAGWDLPERILITVATIDRHRRGVGGAVGARERVELFARMAALAEAL